MSSRGPLKCAGVHWPGFPRSPILVTSPLFQWLLASWLGRPFHLCPLAIRCPPLLDSGSPESLRPGAPRLPFCDHLWHRCLDGSRGSHSPSVTCGFRCIHLVSHRKEKRSHTVARTQVGLMQGPGPRFLLQSRCPCLRDKPTTGLRARTLRSGLCPPPGSA